MLGAGFMLTGCGPDVDAMKAGLVKAGMSAEKASCLAERAADNGVAKGPYEYIAKLMEEGVSEKAAVNKARRKYGADFKTPYEDAKKSCDVM